MAPERHLDTQQFFSHSVGGSIANYYCKLTRRNAFVFTLIHKAFLPVKETFL
jgi:hypothetical protein